ncbi:unnamed protein product [Oikopleura dioica]|uniref:Uncharacterized protein n=1 Tax=Oikopleura dioica TaxID=34765 RepID=Q675V6_OIKDI|nr:hypothetical protein 004-13 [Oikopleura dioica]CBY14276.1 unnamed protein product [Oikopleura dioica]
MGSDNSVPVNSNNNRQYTQQNNQAYNTNWQEFQFRQQQQLQQQMQQWSQVAQMSMQMNNQRGGYSQQNPIHFNLDNSVTLSRSGGEPEVTRGAKRGSARGAPVVPEVVPVPSAVENEESHGYNFDPLAGVDLSSYEVIPGESSSGSGPLPVAEMPDSAAQKSGVWRAKVDLSTVVTPPPPIEFKTLSTFDLKSVSWPMGIPSEDQTWKISGFLVGLLGGIIFICLGLVVFWKCGKRQNTKRHNAR